MGFLGLVDTEEETNVPETPNNKVEPRRIPSSITGSSTGGGSTGSTGVTVVRTQQDFRNDAHDEPFIEESTSYNIVTLQPRSIFRGAQGWRVLP